MKLLRESKFVKCILDTKSRLHDLYYWELCMWKTCSKKALLREINVIMSQVLIKMKRPKHKCVNTI